MPASLRDCAPIVSSDNNSKANVSTDVPTPHHVDLCDPRRWSTTKPSRRHLRLFAAVSRKLRYLSQRVGWHSRLCFVLAKKSGVQRRLRKQRPIRNSVVLKSSAIARK